MKCLTDLKTRIHKCDTAQQGQIVVHTSTFHSTTTPNHTTGELRDKSKAGKHARARVSIRQKFNEDTGGKIWKGERKEPHRTADKGQKFLGETIDKA